MAHTPINIQPLRARQRTLKRRLRLGLHILHHGLDLVRAQRQDRQNHLIRMADCRILKLFLEQAHGLDFVEEPNRVVEIDTWAAEDVNVYCAAEEHCVHDEGDRDDFFEPRGGDAICDSV